MQDASELLFRPYRLGRLELPNRVIMAPLTRNRAGAGNAPTELAVEYYRQRASAGLIITEATQVCPEGQGYEATPGIHSSGQITGWKRVTSAVRAAGGRMFLQLWHVGRVSNVLLQPEGRAPVAPSAVAAKARTFIFGEFRETSQPRALELSEIPGIVQSFRRAAANAVAAGFDGVEIHGANGYLLDQFLRDSSNLRTDAYGGSVENRARLLLEVSEAVAREIGRERTGVRISPVSPANDISDSNPQPLFNYVVERLNEIELLYIHVVEGATHGARDNIAFDYASLRRRFSGTYIANNGYTRELASNALMAKAADLIAFGKPFISNPDLVQRFKLGAALAEPDRETFYGGDRRGYIDYPAL